VTSYLLAREDLRQGGKGSPVIASVREEERLLAESPITDEQVAAEYERRRDNYVHPALAAVDNMSFPIANSAAGSEATLDRAFVVAQATVRVASQEHRFKKDLSDAASVRNGGPFRCDAASDAPMAEPTSSEVPREVRSVACGLRDGSMSRPFVSEDGSTGYVILRAWVAPVRLDSLFRCSDD
jgi:hypothetical protein